MQKLGQEKLSDFMKNLGSYVHQLNVHLLSPHFELKNEEVQNDFKEREKSEDERSQGQIRLEQRYSVVSSIKQDEDSQLLKCRLELEEIERQQRKKCFKQNIEAEIVTEMAESKVDRQQKDLSQKQPQHFTHQKQHNEIKPLNEPEQEKILLTTSQIMAEAIQKQIIEQININDIQSNQKVNNDPQTQNYKVELPSATENIINQDDYVAEQKWEDQRNLNSGNGFINTEEQNRLQFCSIIKDQQNKIPQLDINCNSVQQVTQDNIQECDIFEDHKIIAQDNDSKQKQITHLETQSTKAQNLTSNNLQYNKQNSQILSQGPKVIEQLRQDLVHKITDSLQVIFELFKQKLPQNDEIQIIRELYVKYIGPEEYVQKPKQKLSSKNMASQNHVVNSLSQKILTTDPNLVKENLAKSQLQKQKIQHNIPKINNSSQNTYSPDFDARKIIPHLKFPKVQNLKIQNKASNQIQNKIQQIPKRPYTKRTGQMNQRYIDEQNVAKLFIKKGYGLHVARRYLGENIENNHYTNLITTIIRQTWRKFQDFISRFQQLKPMSTAEYKVIKTSLVQCAKWMDPTDLNTFYGFMKLAYNLDNKQPYEDQAIRLYRTCINRYEQLRGQYDVQTKMKMEKKYFQKTRPSTNFTMRNNLKNNPGFINKDKKIGKVIPNEHELGDLINLIKNQLKQTTNNNNYIPNNNPLPPRPQMTPYPTMTRPHLSMMMPQTQNMNFPRFPQNPMNGQRR